MQEVEKYGNLPDHYKDDKFVKVFENDICDVKFVRPAAYIRWLDRGNSNHVNFS